MEDLEARIKRHEGLRLSSYEDSLGFWTIGYGHFCCSPIPDITEEEAQELLEEDIARAKNMVLRDFPWTADLDQIRFEVLVEMVFQLGIVTFKTFHKMLAACQAKDWATAANEMLDSLWHKQTPSRCEELANMMLTGKCEDL